MRGTSDLSWFEHRHSQFLISHGNYSLLVSNTTAINFKDVSEIIQTIIWLCFKQFYSTMPRCCCCCEMKMSNHSLIVKERERERKILWQFNVFVVDQTIRMMKTLFRMCKDFERKSIEIKFQNWVWLSHHMMISPSNNIWIT